VLTEGRPWGLDTSSRTLSYYGEEETFFLPKNEVEVGQKPSTVPGAKQAMKMTEKAGVY
jgi:hypothetical protein